jgi:hypothetical protein
MAVNKSQKNLEDVSANKPIKHAEKDLQYWRGRIEAYSDILYMILEKDNERKSYRLDC